jgi:hypothetical protein
MTVRFQPVETGIREGEQVEITSGLQDGARVITTGAGALRDGDRVVPMANPQGGGDRAERNGDGQRPQKQGSTR